MAAAARRRKTRNFHDFFILTALSITRESVIVVLKHLSFFTFIAVFLISPVSAATIISRTFLDHLPVTQLALQIQGLCNALSYPELVYHKLSETIISYMLCFPIVVTFSLLARAAVAHTVAYIYAGNRPSWEKVIQAPPKLWKGLVVTYICGCLIIFGSSVLIFVSLMTLVNFISILGLSADWAFGAALGGGVVYSIVFAHAIVVCNLATIVCVLEDGCQGMEAIFRAMFLIRGRIRAALLMLIITSLSLTSVESLFEYRVMGNGNMYCFGCVGETLMVIFVYSFLALLDVVMSSVFYYTCKAAHLEGLCISLQSSFFSNPLEDPVSSSSSHKILVN